MPLGEDLVRQIRDATPLRRRKQMAGARVRLRTLTHSVRALPDLLVIGAQRSGTSSLYKHLGQHHDVIASLRKETEFFSTSYPQGEAWYRAHFPLKARLAASQARGQRRPLTFEATPDYMLDPRAAERAAALVPEARIIALLRNPVDRAFSQYLHNRRLGHESLSFESALAAEPGRLEGEFDRLWQDPEYPARVLRRHSYVTRGFYADQLERWTRWFPAEATLMLLSDALFADPAAAFADVTRHLGLEPWTPKRFNNYSYAAADVAPTARMPNDVRVRLHAVFEPHNRRLAELMGVDPGWNPGANP